MDISANPATIKANLLEAWKTANDKARAAVMIERDLRLQVIEAFSTETNEMASGIENIDIGYGFDLKIQHKLDYKLDNANDCEALDKALDAIETSMEGGKIIAERLVKWKPELSVSEYKLLGNEQRAMIDKVLTIKPASKSLEIKKRGK